MSADEPPFNCADCGRPLTLRHGNWAYREGRGRYVFTCRDHMSTKPDGTLFLEAADYHYVAGETQRRWVPPSVR